MPILPKYQYFGANAPVLTRSYRGPDRRSAELNGDDTEITRKVNFDDKGNPVLDVRTNAPRRREDDKTIDLLECLNADGLGLELADD